MAKSHETVKKLFAITNKQLNLKIIDNNQNNGFNVEYSLHNNSKVTSNSLKLQAFFLKMLIKMQLHQKNLIFPEK